MEVILEFIKQYWWCFLILVALIMIAIVGLAIGNKQKKAERAKEHKEEQQEKQNVEVKQEQKPAKKPAKKAEKKPEEAKPVKKQVENEEQKPAEKKEVKKEKQRKQVYMISYDKENKEWIVKKTEGERASKRCKTKAEALEVAKKLSESQDLKMSVKKKNGKFQKQ